MQWYTSQRKQLLPRSCDNNGHIYHKKLLTPYQIQPSFWLFPRCIHEGCHASDSSHITPQVPPPTTPIPPVKNPIFIQTTLKHREIAQFSLFEMNGRDTRSELEFSPAKLAVNGVLQAWKSVLFWYVTLIWLLLPPPSPSTPAAETPHKRLCNKSKTSFKIITWRRNKSANTKPLNTDKPASDTAVMAVGGGSLSQQFGDVHDTNSNALNPG